MIPAWVSRYVGIPFADAGYSIKGCNCWGLCHLVLKNEAGIETPTFGEYCASDLLGAAKQFCDNAASATWRAVNEPMLFDVVLMHAMTDDRRHRLPGHVGIMINALRVLHVWDATAACHMPLDHPRIRFRVIGFHRHINLQ